MVCVRDDLRYNVSETAGEDRHCTGQCTESVSSQVYAREQRAGLVVIVFGIIVSAVHLAIPADHPFQEASKTKEGKMSVSCAITPQSRILSVDQAVEVFPIELC